MVLRVRIPGREPEVGSLNRLSTILGLNGINPVCRKAERTAVFLNACSRIDVSVATNPNLLKPEHPEGVAASTASA